MELRALALLCLVYAAPASSSPPKHAELAWVPGEPDLVMAFDRASSTDADLFRRFQDEFLFATGTRSRFQDLLSLTDLDPSFHIHRSVVTVYRKHLDDAVLIMALTPRPDIAQKTMTAKSDASACASSESPVRFYPTEDASLALALFETGLIVYGEVALVEQSAKLFRARGSEPTDQASGWRSRVPDIDSGAAFWAMASPHWLAFDFSSETLSSASIRGRSLCQGLLDIEAVSYSARFSTQVDFQMKARAKDEEDATILADALEQNRLSALSGSGPTPPLNKAVQASRTERHGRTLGFSIPLDRGALTHLYHSETGRNLITWRLGEESREERQRIADILHAMNVGVGSRVADVGAGGGFLTVRLARAVGRAGHVYAEDIREGSVQSLRDRVRRADLYNTEVILGAEDDPKLPEGVLDAVVIVNAYHEMPSHEAMLARIHQALKPGGRLVLVEPFDSDQAPDTREAQMEKHVIDPALVEDELREAGFEIVAREDRFIPYEECDCERFDWMIVAQQVSSPSDG